MKHRVNGIHAPTPRMTKAAALLLAIAVSVPVFVILTVVDTFLV